MQISLSKMDNNLSEIYGQKCSDKNYKSQYEFKGIKNDKLSYKCKECKKRQ